MKAAFEHIVGKQVRLWAVAQDDERVLTMWTLIYPPSWQHTQSREELIADPVILPRIQDGFGEEYVLQKGVEMGMYCM